MLYSMSGLHCPSDRSPRAVSWSWRPPWRASPCSLRCSNPSGACEWWPCPGNCPVNASEDPFGLLVEKLNPSPVVTVETKPPPWWQLLPVKWQFALGHIRDVALRHFCQLSPPLSICIDIAELITELGVHHSLSKNMKMSVTSKRIQMRRFWASGLMTVDCMIPVMIHDAIRIPI